MREGHVFLVGFMGSGKTSVGLRLGPALALPFVDLDERIAGREGRSIAAIFGAQGEAYFRRLETCVLMEVLEEPPAVVALGGGTFVPLENRRRIREKGTCIWLAVSLTEAQRRCDGKLDRPLARDPVQFARLYEERLTAYRDCDLKVETDGRTPRDISREIVSHLETMNHALD